MINFELFIDFNYIVSDLSKSAIIFWQFLNEKEIYAEVLTLVDIFALKVAVKIGIPCQQHHMNYSVGGNIAFIIISVRLSYPSLLL